MARVDDELARGGNLLARAVAREIEDGLDLPQAARDALEDIEIPGRSLAVFDASGAVVLGRWEGLPQEANDGAGERGTTMEFLDPQITRRALFVHAKSVAAKLVEVEL